MRQIHFEINHRYRMFCVQRRSSGTPVLDIYGLSRVLIGSRTYLKKVKNLKNEFKITPTTPSCILCSIVDRYSLSNQHRKHRESTLNNSRGSHCNMKVTRYLSFLAFLSLGRAWTPSGFARLNTRVSGITLNMAVDKTDPAVAKELAKIEDMPLDKIRKELKENGKRPRVTMSDAEVKMLLAEMRLDKDKDDKTAYFAKELENKPAKEESDDKKSDEKADEKPAKVLSKKEKSDDKKSNEKADEKPAKVLSKKEESDDKKSDEKADEKPAKVLSKKEKSDDKKSNEKADEKPAKVLSKKEESDDKKSDEKPAKVLSKFEEEMKTNPSLETFYNELEDFGEEDSMKIVEEYVNDPEAAQSTYEEEHSELLDEIDAVLEVKDEDEGEIEDDDENEGEVDDDEEEDEIDDEEDEIDDEEDEIDDEEDEEPVVKKPTRKPKTRKRTVKTREAHIDCSNGVDELSILASCLDACTSSRSEASSLMSQIGNRVKEEMGDTSDRKSSTTIIEDDDGVRGLKISIIKNDAEYDKFSVAETVSLEELSFFCRRKSKFFEESTKKTCMDLFAELATVIEEIRGVEARAIQVSLDSVVQVMAIVHCLSKLDVKRISCTPLNVGNIETGSLDMALIDELLVGMTVDRDKIINGASSPLGVALLRVLTNAHRSKQTQKRSMISVTTGRGSSDANPFGLVCIVGEQESKGKKKVSRKGASPSRTRKGATKGSSTKKTGGKGKRTPTVDTEEGAPMELIESELWRSDYVAHLQTNIDDMTSEHLSYVTDLLLEKGAMDTWLVPIIMKKGRAAHTLHCLCDSDEEMTKPLLEIIFRHTTTLGVRCYVDVPRAKLYRNTVSVQTAYSDTSRDGIVDVKVATFQDGEVMSMKAEFDHCKVITAETGTPIKFVSDAAVAAARAHVYGNSRNEDYEDDYDDYED
jgi:uncharacterized protein (DUF111 family)